MVETFFELLQVSIGQCDRLSMAPSSDEWRALLCMARKQALSGMCMAALEKLPDSQWPPKNIVLEWEMESQMIGRRNKDVNKAAVAVAKWFSHKGFKCCILKGQGNALMYPNPAARIPGDIDIWIDGGARKAISLARKIGITGKAYYHHIEWGPYDDVEVEVHYRPSFMFNPIHNSRLQAWFSKHSAVQFANTVCLPYAAGTVPVPTFEFNAVFQLVHLSNHFFHEGIGLRQFADYYFLLVGNGQKLADEQQKIELTRNLSRFGLYSFAGAVMWVLKTVFQLNDEYMIAEPDERRGHLLMDEILAGGNFGKYDMRVLSGAQKSAFRHNIARIYRDIRLCRLFPSECLCEPFFRFWHIFWRIFH